MRTASATVLLTIGAALLVVLLSLIGQSSNDASKVARRRPTTLLRPLPLMSRPDPRLWGAGSKSNSSMFGASITAASSSTSATSPASSPPRLHVLTFADRPNVYLHALAAAVVHHNGGEPLYVLGLSGRRTPMADAANPWNISRKAISGTDPGKLKKLWFVGALTNDARRLERLGFAERDVLLFLDAFDCIVQRPLVSFVPSFEAFVRSRSQEADASDALVLLAEHSCWPWPLPGVSKKGRPRGVSMDYMAGSHFDVFEMHAREQASAPPGLMSARRRRTVEASQMCAELRERAGAGSLWEYPNSGVFAGSVKAVRESLRRVRGLVLRGHFEDQGMFGLAMLEHERGAILVDGNATLFASQYAYNPNWWARPACFHDYFDRRGQPPMNVLTGTTPFALHFNGPAGRHRLGWCTVAALRSADTRRGRAGGDQGAQDEQGSSSRSSLLSWRYVDVDHEGLSVPIPRYCGGGPPEAGSKGAAPPASRSAVQLKPCDKVEPPSLGSRRRAEEDHRATSLSCVNDRCWA